MIENNGDVNMTYNEIVTNRKILDFNLKTSKMQKRIKNTKKKKNKHLRW